MSIALMVITQSDSDHAETLKRLLEAVAQRGLEVFANIDHAGGAREVGLELAEENVVVFGNPRAGTPLMQSDPRIGIELPLRILVWTRTGGVTLGYQDPRELADRYAVSEHLPVLVQMSELLADLARTAAGHG